MDKIIALRRKRGAGFTLIELMITVAIIGILAAIAYPSYQQHIIKSNRAAAQSQMMDIANREQQYFLANRSYALKAVLESSGYALPSNIATKYDYDVDTSKILDASCAAVAGTGTLPSYVITFTAKNTQFKDGNLMLSSEGVKCPAGRW